MFVESIEVASTALSAIELSEKIIPTFIKILRLLKNGQVTIAIFGAGGSGKSTLGKLFSGDLEPISLSHSYQESVTIEKYKLEGNAFGSFLVAPGQERRQDTWSDMLRSISSGKVQIVINVAAWGCHSFQDFRYSEHRLFHEGMSLDQFIGLYLDDRRSRELDVLRTLEPHLSVANSRKLILITLITKQDLWWNERLDVQRYYTQGPYEQIIQNIRNRLGSSNFIHEYMSASLVMENFLSGSGEMLIPVTQGYDQRLKAANMRHFLNAIEKHLNVSLNLNDG